jgi:hypothetical protein
MNDFKKMPKMANGGAVKKYNEGGEVNKNTIEYWANKRSPESKAAAEQRMTEYKEGKAKSSAQFKENMQKTSETHDAKMKAIFNPPKSGGGGGGSMGGGDMSGMKGLDRPYKRGGKVTKKKK